MARTKAHSTVVRPFDFAFASLSRQTLRTRTLLRVPAKAKVEAPLVLSLKARVLAAALAVRPGSRRGSCSSKSLELLLLRLNFGLLCQPPVLRGALAGGAVLLVGCVCSSQHVHVVLLPLPPDAIHALAGART